MSELANLISATHHKLLCTLKHTIQTQYRIFYRVVVIVDDVIRK